jgi:uncharacterized repeat protein (TIGR01451 family)
MFGMLNSLEAQIVYSGVQNAPVNIPTNFNQASINLDQSGGNDLEIQNNTVGAVAFIQINEMAAGNVAVNAFMGTIQGLYAYPSALNAGAVIGAGGPWVNGSGDANSLADNGAYPNPKWETDGMTKFVGFRATLGGGTKYGWVRLTRTTHTNWTFVDWAFQSNGGSIEAGQTASASVADVAIAKSVLPTTGPAGTVVTYSLALTNNGPDAATGVEVTDIVPVGMTFVPGSMTGSGTYNSASPAGTGLKWTGISLGNGASTTLTFQATVN